MRYCRRSPRPAFERRGVSAMRPSCVTADGRHVLRRWVLATRPSCFIADGSRVLLSSDVLHQLRDPSCFTADGDHVPLSSDGS